MAIANTSAKAHLQRHAFVSIATSFFAAILLASLIFLVVFVAIKGSSYFWPMTLYQLEYIDKQTSKPQKRYQLSPLSIDDLEQNFLDRFSAQFLVDEQNAPLVSISIAQDVYQVSLKNGKNKFGQFLSLHTPNDTYRSLEPFENVMQQVEELLISLEEIQSQHLARIHKQISTYDKGNVSSEAPARLRMVDEFNHWEYASQVQRGKLKTYYIELIDAMGQMFHVPLSDIDYVVLTNNMSMIEKLSFMILRAHQFLFDEPKQASTSGGVFPALFGTVLMVILMAVLVAPLGIITAIYLNEYAPDNAANSLIRISISNMAGVPSVVYGVFGLGFFVYVVGGSIDELFYADTLPSPTFGTPGLFWASLTMALLTLPVVIVSTEEGLRRVPSGLRSGAYALGATKFETILKTVIPIASPGMMTGLILAVARAAGEVAPLILVGAVKYAPLLPIDGEFPFLHLERQFMHLGVFIYEGAFVNQTNTQGSAMMFASCMLLLLIVFVLNLFAILVRNKLKKRYTS